MSEPLTRRERKLRRQVRRFERIMASGSFEELVDGNGRQFAAFVIPAVRLPPPAAVPSSATGRRRRPRGVTE